MVRDARSTIHGNDRARRPSLGGILLVASFAFVAAVTLAGGEAQAAQQQAMITPSDPGDNNYFGSAVAVDGDTAAIGTPGHAQGSDDSRAQRGAVYVFSGNGGSWSEETKITQPDAKEGDSFGASVALDGDTLVVGAPGNDSAGGLVGDYGTVFVYAGDGSDYTLEAVLQPEDNFDGMEFGTDVAIDGDTIVVGAPGNVESAEGFDYNRGSFWVAQGSGGSWSLSEEVRSPKDGYEGFGAAVAFDGTTTLVGAPGGGTNTGHVYAYAASDWNQTDEMEPEDAELGGHFGASIAFHGDTLVAGAPGTEYGTLDTDQGAAYAFVRGDDGWTEDANLTPEDIDSRAGYGQGVALSADGAVVGGPGNDTAYEIPRSGGSWSEPTAFRPDGGASDTGFGGSTVLAGDTALVGAASYDGDGERQGAVYAFGLGEADGGDGTDGGDGGDGTNGGADGTDGAGGNGAPGPGAAAVAASLAAGAAVARSRR